MIIGFVGTAGSGKGTCGDYLVEKYGFKAESFAAPLKDACAAIFNWNRDLLEGATKESRAWRSLPDTYWSGVLGRQVTPRSILQELGTEVLRHRVSDTIWIDSLLARIKKDENYVITDVRFENEIDRLRSQGAQIVRVDRNVEDWQSYTVSAKEYMKKTGAKFTHLNEFHPDLPEIHISEWDWILSSFDYYIKNESTVFTLKQRLDIMMTDLQSVKR